MQGLSFHHSYTWRAPAGKQSWQAGKQSWTWRKEKKDSWLHWAPRSSNHWSHIHFGLLSKVLVHFFTLVKCFNLNPFEFSFCHLPVTQSFLTNAVHTHLKPAHLPSRSDQETEGGWPRAKHLTPKIAARQLPKCSGIWSAAWGSVTRLHSVPGCVKLAIYPLPPR